MWQLFLQFVHYWRVRCLLQGSHEFDVFSANMHRRRDKMTTICNGVFCVLSLLTLHFRVNTKSNI